MSEKFGIICNARVGKGIRFLALVDRGKSKRLWWTSDDAAIAIRYNDKRAAEFACSRLKRNNPRVVNWRRVEAMLNDQADIRERLENEWLHEAACAEMEDGWDGHRNAF